MRRPDKPAGRLRRLGRQTVLVALVGVTLAHAEQPAPEAREIIRAAMENWRGTTSHSVITMTIHRPDWERRMTMRSWSRGDQQSLVRVMAPARDAGNATLLDDRQMWTFAPRINRIIKIPSSMMNQSWMGSDFSNKDISKSTDIIDQYEHSLLATEQQDGHTVYTIAAVPHESAAIVWGREVLRVRDDWVLLEQQFRDQDDRLVKTLETREVAEMGGRPVARVMRMSNQDAPEEWTEVEVLEVEFDLVLEPALFTLSNLRNPRP